MSSLTETESRRERLQRELEDLPELAEELERVEVLVLENRERSHVANHRAKYALALSVAALLAWGVHVYLLR